MGEFLEVTVLDGGPKVGFVGRLEVRRQNVAALLEELIRRVVMDFRQDSGLEEHSDGFGGDTGDRKLRFVVGVLHG